MELETRKEEKRGIVKTQIGMEHMFEAERDRIGRGY